MPKTPVPFGIWRPDLALLDNEFSADVENVFAGLNSYTPVPSLLPFTNGQLPGECVGLTSARTTDGEWRIYGGTPTKLYRWTHAGWADFSRTTGGDYAVPFNERWSFAQFGKWLVAVQLGDVPQVADVDAGTPFAALAGSPPVAHNVRTIGDFLVLGGLASNRRKIMWSGINDITQWTIGLNLCDEQEFPDGGPVQGVAGGEIGYVVQDRAIRLMQFLPADTTFIFSFTKVVQDRGSITEHGYVTVANTLYFLAEDGFYALNGAQLSPIGYEHVNDWFLKNSDIGRRNVVLAIATNKPWVMWPYHSSGASQTYDAVIAYNWATQRWTKLKIAAQMWANLASIELDLDTDDVADPDDEWLDSLSPALDSFAYVGGRPVIAAIDPNGVLGTLNGPNLQATLESTEVHLNPAGRAFVTDVYPLIDAAQCVVEVGTRERLQDPVQWQAGVPLEVTGSATVCTSSRLHRFRCIIPAGDKWTHAQGALAEAQQDGTVA